MALPGPPTSSHPDPSPGGSPRREPYGDPWQAFGYLVAGVLFYGFIGFLLDRWLDTRLLVVVGILFGAGLGIYMSFGKFGSGARAEQSDTQGSEQDHQEREE